MGENMDNDFIFKKKLAQIYKKIKFILEYHNEKVCSDKEGNVLLRELLNSNKPLMISRFGATELQCINSFLNNNNYSENTKWRIKNLSGVFSNTNDGLDDFSKIYLESAKDMDVVAVWALDNEKRIIAEYCNENIRIIRPRSLEPYYFDMPWSSVLEGKKVLIIHPFKDSIVEQYKYREKIFKNYRILPKFDTLEVLKSVQTIAGENADFNNWVEAYEYMCNEISRKTFDIAIVGAGAYGLPLCSYIKRIGKQSIHMGGSTQVLFGIKGRRWDKHSTISKMYNTNWVRPRRDETPKGAEKVEGGSYW